jgi:putative Mn2+ efflux pump MntP
MIDKIGEYFKAGAENLNANKYFIGFTMILLNIGARFIIDELDDDLRKIVSGPYVRRFFIFCSFFMATKDVFTAIILTIVFVIIINEVMGTDEKEKEEKKGGASYNKAELDKTIQKLKTIQSTM